MATVDNKQMIDAIIAANNGYYGDGPRVYMIVEYTNWYGNTTWGITWERDRDKDKYLIESEYVRNPKILWKSQ